MKTVWVLLPFLLLQAALGLYRLDLLPTWGDENHTLEKVLPPWDGSLCDRDVHPPLYFLLARGWVRLGWPDPLLSLRALSVLFLLISTVVIDRIWLARLRQFSRVLFLSLWTLSPCLLLYGRMARSYTLQVLLFLLVVAAARRLLDRPDSPRIGLVYCLSAAALLYLHYIPGLAAVGAVGGVLLWRRRIQVALLSGLLVLLLYAPWLICLSQAASIVARKEVYRLVPSLLLDQGVRLAYWFVSFFYGETPPVWAIAGGLLLAPALLFLLVDSFRSRAEWRLLIAPAALLGYLGIGQWASFAFVPARLLWLLPFAWLAIADLEQGHRRLRTAVAAALLCLSAGSIHSYFGKQDFLNKGYLIPYQEIASLFEKSADPNGAIVLLDLDQIDTGPFAARAWPAGIRLVRDAAALPALLAKRPAATLWHLRRQYPEVPLAAQLGGRYALRRYTWVPYSRLDRAIMEALGWARRPTHVVEALEFRPVLK